ncbi:MAG: TM2 domain-containing protein [Acidiferrobacterales bacterium]
MKQTWKKLDLEGGGLQSANLRLVQRLKQRNIAYGLWFLFPLGGHRVYLDDHPCALAYTGLTAVAIMLTLSVGILWALVPAAFAAAWAMYDLRWIDRRVTQLNKQIRLAEYLRSDNQPPAGFRGHYTDDAGTPATAGMEGPRHDGDSAGATATAQGRKRIPSFAEQERLLRELTKPK